MKIYIIAGKAKSGKDTLTNIIRKHYKVSSIELSFAYYLKHYVSKISGWDLSENSKPRTLLQLTGTKIRSKLGPLFFVKRMIDDIKIYEDYFELIVISDARMISEIEEIRKHFNNVTVIRLVRPNFNNNLKLSEQQHETEIGLDSYDDFDYVIVNDGSIEDLEKKAIKVIEGDKNEH